MSYCIIITVILLWHFYFDCTIRVFCVFDVVVPVVFAVVGALVICHLV